MPLADKIRPMNIDDMVGQKHLIGNDGIIRKLLESGNIPNIIFYGNPGVGKTTLANIIAKRMDRKYVKLNAVNCGVKDIKDAISESKKEGCSGIVLMLDEIQAMNKKQQQSLLEVIEDGYVCLIASTADNPFFSIYKAILSRCSIFEFKPIDNKDIIEGLARAIKIVKSEYKEVKIAPKAIEYIADTCNGDMRNALNQLELVLEKCVDRKNNTVKITVKDIEEISLVKLIGYDKSGDMHYDILSAFHKSCRNSDADAALHYLARLIKAGAMQDIIRRLLCIASEDIGLSCPQAITIVESCVQSALILGFPEARLPLAQATVYLCRCTKSDSITIGITCAQHDVDNIDVGDIPLHLKDAHYSSAKKLGRGIDYKYPHNYPNHYVEQQCLPDNLKDRVYYIPGDNAQEKAMEDYWNRIKNKK